jgi:hypothetical protein
VAQGEVGTLSRRIFPYQFENFAPQAPQVIRKQGLVIRVRSSEAAAMGEPEIVEFNPGGADAS